MVAQHRPLADGFPKAPVIEAIIDVEFKPAVNDAVLEKVSSDLAEFYPQADRRVRRFKLSASAETVSVSEETAHFHLTGSDPTEIGYWRSDGFSSVQLAPYRCWEDLFGRFQRDVALIRREVAFGPTRVATRFINRIDIQLEGHLARHEEYFQTFIKVPDHIFPDIGQFSFEFQRAEDNGVWVNVRSSVSEPARPDVASFILDIDTWRVNDLPTDWNECITIIDSLREVKNHYYRSLLTEKALEEFA